MKTSFRLMVVSSFCMLFAFAGCEKDDGGNRGQVDVTEITLDRNVLELTVGDTEVLTATVMPKNATDKDIVWSSSDVTVAAVDGGGTVIAVAEGEAFITVTTEDGNVEAHCDVTVNAAAIPVTSIKTAWKRYSFEVEEKFTIDVVLEPADATRDLEWSSSNATVVQVDDYGVMEAVMPGSAVVTVKDRNSDVKAEISLTVLPMPAMDACQDAVPNWGETLGEVTFRTDRIWEIGEQIWSDVVLTSICSGREAFSGSVGNNTEEICADCRKGHDGYGNLFTQCAVVKYRKELCPDGWRVPTAEDMVALNKALGGNGENLVEWGSPEGEELLGKYISDWGAELAGNCTPDGQMPPVNIEGYYWTQTQHNQFEISGGNPSYAIYTGLKKNGFIIYTCYATPKSYGMSLRCVR